MSVTISTHNGTTVARQHNIREKRVVEKESHIDLDGVHEIWHDEDIREAYERIFGEAVATYNAKQKRENRKIESYYDEVCKDERRHPVYEMIIGVYGDECTEENGKEIMRKFVDTWEERNPNLKLVGAYYHADEDGVPHCHIDYVPTAHGYKRGLAMQNGLDRALTEQGFKTESIHKTAQIAWEQRENAYLEELCNEKGLEVEHPDKDKNVEHLKTDIYKARQEYVKIQAMNEELKAENEFLKNETAKTNAEAQAMFKKFKALEAKIGTKTEEMKLNLSMCVDAMRNIELNAKKLLEKVLTHEQREEYLHNINRDIKAIDRYIQEAECDDYER